MSFEKRDQVIKYNKDHILYVTEWDKKPLCYVVESVDDENIRIYNRSGFSMNQNGVVIASTNINWEVGDYIVKREKGKQYAV